MPPRPRPRPIVPELPKAVAAEARRGLPRLDRAAFDDALAGSPYRWEDYRAARKSIMSTA